VVASLVAGFQAFHRSTPYVPSKSQGRPSATPQISLSGSLYRMAMEARSDVLTPLSPMPVAQPLDQDSKDLEHTSDGEHPSRIPSRQSEDVPPDGGYGWICVACNFLINGHTWGINSTYGVFLSYYLSHNYFPNTSSLVYAFIGGLSISQAVLIAPLATRVVHSYGTRICLHCGIFFQTLSLIGASFAKKKYQIILSQGICFGWGMGFLFVGSVGIISQWFLKKRSLANAIAASGSGIGALIYSLATQRIIDTMGLAWAFRILGIVTFVVNLVASNLLRDRNVAVGSRHKGFDFKLLKRPEFLLLQAWSYFSMLGYTSVIFSAAAYAVSIKLTAKQGALVSAILNLGQAIGRPIIGLISDRYGRLNVASVCTLACGLCCFAFWIPAEAAPSKMGLLTFFAIVGGALAGTFWCTIPAVSAEIVGLKDLPTALSMTWVLMVPPTTVAEPIALELRKSHGNYIFLNAQIFTAMMYVGGALSLWIVRGWKVGEIEDLEKRLREKGVNVEDLKSIERKAVVDGGHVISSSLVDGTRWQLRDLARRMWAWKRV
jgi:MFS family permease